ncbi:MAG: hypothetical protein ABR581_01800 [Thermoleophilaceae bacterium]
MRNRLEAYASRAGIDGVTVEVRGAEHTTRVKYRTSLAPAGATADSVLALTLLVAMRLGLPLALREGASPRLLAAVPTLQAIFSSWDPGLQRVPVDADGRAVAAATRGEGVACFFSGGVDSFYTLLANRQAVTHIVFVHGFDLRLEAADARAGATQTAAAVARELDLQLVEVETDLRELVDRHLPWGFAHGPALASVGLLFQECFREVLVPATHTYADLLPWGSHPLVDPLWSTELTEFVHHGADTTRIDKCRLLADSETAMSRLRVCWENPGSRQNCGECEKCLRTMVNLAAVGALERCSTLPDRLEPDEIAGMTLRDANDRAFAVENLQALERLGAEPALQSALRESLTRQDAGRRDDAAEAGVRELRGRQEMAERALSDVQSSASWRLTAPLRAAKRLLSRSRSG